MTAIVLKTLRLARMSTAAKPAMHDAIKPLSWLLGKWKSQQGKGYYPTITDFVYSEELEFFHVGQPNIQFSWYSFHPEKGTPMHREVGFIRVKPGTNIVAVNCAHNTVEYSTGVAEVEEGEISEDRLTIHSHTVGRLTFGKPPQTTEISRVFTKLGEGGLKQVVSMATSNTPMTEHLSIEYIKTE